MSRPKSRQRGSALASWGCIVLSRDYDPLTIINEMMQPIKVAERAWLVRKVMVDRDCLRDCS